MGVTPPRTSPPRQTTPPREPAREPTPPAPAGAYAAIYVTVYEWTGPIFAGIPRTFMRHSGIIVQPEPDVEDLEVYHVVGTPSVGLTYKVVKNWKNPRDESVTLIAMNFVAWVPRQRVIDIQDILGLVRPQISRSWNCQNWVREGLQKMVEAGLITEQQMHAAVVQQQRAINLPYAGNTPNLRALDG